MTTARQSQPTPVTSRPAKSLFALRWALGRAFRWDAPRRQNAAGSYRDRLTDDDRARSMAPPGTVRGIFRLLYLFADETAMET